MKYKILFVHNKYGAYSGEEAMLEKIMQVLVDHGHQVYLFSEDSGALSKGLLAQIMAFFTGIYSFSAKAKLKKVIAAFQPDIVQVQNLFPLISPSILPMLRRIGLPVVMRLANYRLVCPNGLFLSHGQICEKCRGGREYYCVLQNCENSLPKSIGYAIRSFIARYMRLYIDNVTRYYAQTIFQKEILIAEGYPEGQIDVIPNMVGVTRCTEPTKIGDFVGYVGRMSGEKGIDLFFKAAQLCPEIPFKVAGHPRAGMSLTHIPANVEILGYLDKDALFEFYRDCRFIIMPSRCYEGFPSVVIEAMDHAKPVIASDIGGISEIVDNQTTGLLFAVGNISNLRALITRLWNDETAIHDYGRAGKDKVIREYSSELYYRRLLKIYEKAFDEGSVPQ